MEFAENGEDGERDRERRRQRKAVPRARPRPGKKQGPEGREVKGHRWERWRASGRPGWKMGLALCVTITTHFFTEAHAVLTL